MTGLTHYKQMNAALKQDIKDRIHTGEINTFLTLNPNKHCHNRNKLECLFSKYDKWIRGRVLKNKLSEQYYGYAFIEQGNDYDVPHLHALVHIPETHLEYHQEKAARIWKTIHPFGSSAIEQINPETVDAIVDYFFKEASRNFYDTNPNDLERLIVIARPQ